MIAAKNFISKKTLWGDQLGPDYVLLKKKLR